MKSLIISVVLVTVITGCSKMHDNLELEYEVFNQTFSQLEPTSCLYQNKFLYTIDSAFNEEQVQFIKRHLSFKNIDTNNLNIKYIELFFLKDNLKEINYPDYGNKGKIILDIEKINSNSKAILILATDTLFMNRKHPNKEIELSRVLFNIQRTKAVYELSTINYEDLSYVGYRVFSNYKNGAWYISKTERKNYEYR